MKKNILIITVILGINVLLSSSLLACATFMLKTDKNVVFGHNLNTGKHIPGLIFINKQGQLKSGKTWKSIISSEENNESSIQWVSKFGSVTFNCFGRDLPDGGMNEKGLYIWEMTGATTFDSTTKKPKLFMSHWIQYQLDNYSSVDEVLQNINDIGLDGWNWQFFIADISGQTASVEYINGLPMIVRTEQMPIPLMGNGKYEDDLNFIKEFSGFGGTIPINMDDKQLPDFVKAAKMLEEYNGEPSLSDYGFEILNQLSSKAKWSVIMDYGNMNVYYKTAKHPAIKTFSINSFDFAPNTPVMILNIQDSTINNHVDGKFSKFNYDSNLQLSNEITEIFFTKDQFEISSEEIANQLASVYKTNMKDHPKAISGQWTGHAEYPTTGEPATVEWNLNINEQSGEISGEITDSVGLLTDTKIWNGIYENGILKFTVYSYGYVFKILGSTNNNEIAGVFDISNETRKGNFKIERIHHK